MDTKPLPGYLIGAAVLAVVVVVVLLAVGSSAMRPPVERPEPAPAVVTHEQAHTAQAHTDPAHTAQAHAEPAPTDAAPLSLPELLQGKAEVLSPDDPDYARAQIEKAEKPAGQGGLVDGLVIRMTADIPVYRLWNGPDVKNDKGYTNRLGEYWAYDQPTGTVEQYRANYEVCVDWNQLTWVAVCTLRAGAVVAIGPGQSVAAGVCKDPQESYPVNTTHWQTYIAGAFARSTELDCSDESKDFKADPDNLREPAKG